MFTMDEKTIKYWKIQLNEMSQIELIDLMRLIIDILLERN